MSGRPPVPFEPYDGFLHGTKADLAVGDLLVPGRESNVQAGRVMTFVSFAATLDAATWGAELARGGGRGRIDVVEPTGPYEDDPNVTDKRLPGNPTRWRRCGARGATRSSTESRGRRRRPGVGEIRCTSAAHDAETRTCPCRSGGRRTLGPPSLPEVLLMLRARSRPSPVVAVLAALAVLAGVLVSIAGAAPSQAAERADGPRLRAEPAALAASLRCTKNLGTSRKRAVLLVHGTGATPRENFSWNVGPLLRRERHPHCTVALPERGLGDMQVNVEHVVHAIRAVHRRSGAKVAVVGHSQGAFLPSYALRVWPDLADKVEDLVGFAGVYTTGTDLADAICVLPCAEAFRQFRPGSRLLAQLVQRPLPAGPSYTAFSTRLDQVVVPQPAASRLEAPGVRNYVLQRLCPTDTADHLTIIAERVFLDLAMDAITRPGPGRLQRVGRTRCGFDREVLDAAPNLPGFGTGLVSEYARNLSVREPALRGYWQRA